MSVAGDVWLLGRHRLLCGDSTSAADVRKVLGAVKPHLMVTDPPYGVDYDPAWRADANKWKGSNVKIGAKAMGRVSQRRPGRLDRRRGSCSPAMSPTSGTAVCAALNRRKAWSTPGSLTVHHDDSVVGEDACHGLAARALALRIGLKQSREVGAYRGFAFNPESRP